MATSDQKSLPTVEVTFSPITLRVELATSDEGKSLLTLTGGRIALQHQGQDLKHLVNTALALACKDAGVHFNPRVFWRTHRIMLDLVTYEILIEAKKS